MAPAGGPHLRSLPPQKRVCMTEQTLATPIDDRQQQERGFSRYQSLLIALLALAQFTLILDFVIMSPLGAILMPALDITAGQFCVAGSALSVSARVSGGFAPLLAQLVRPR